MIAFLDSSALVKLFVQEAGSPELAALLRRFRRDQVAIACVTHIETRSVLQRRLRNLQISQDAFRYAADAVALVSTSWIELPMGLAEKEQALGVVARHALRSLDAIQLGSALELRRASLPEDEVVFLASDERLLAAATADGLLTWNPESGPAPVNLKG